MAQMTLAANVGQGEATFSTTGSWSDGGSRLSTDYTTYEFVAAPANGWMFVRWETQERTQSYTSSHTDQWTDWTSWNSFSSSLSATKDFITGSSYNYGSTWGSGGTRYEHKVRAVFAEVRPSYTITVNVSSESPAYSGTVSGGGTYSDGATCTITATPASGYHFVKWTCSNGTEVADATHTFTVSSSLTFTAQFREYTHMPLFGTGGAILFGSGGLILCDA